MHVIYNASLEQLFGISYSAINATSTNALAYDKKDPVLKGISMGIFRKFSGVITYPDEAALRPCQWTLEAILFISFFILWFFAFPIGMSPSVLGDRVY